MRPYHRHLAALALVTLSAGAIAAAALDPKAAAALDPKAAVATRQAGFKRMGAAFKTINDQLKADAPAKDQIVAAARIVAATARAQPALFPAGSGASAGVPNDALPAVWSQRPAFDAQMAKLVAETGKLATVAAGGDLAAIREQARATGAVCRACHTQFRADD